MELHSAMEQPMADLYDALAKATDTVRRELPCPETCEPALARMWQAYTMLMTSTQC